MDHVSSQAGPPTSGNRTQPWNQEAEESVIGGILFNGRALNQVGELLLPE